jgi:hypothetical protein
MRRLAAGLILALAAGLPAAPASGESASPAVSDLLYGVLPVTPGQARELAALLQAPGTVTVDVADATSAVLDVAPSLPSALLQDVVTAPARHLHLLRGLATDAVELVARRQQGEARGVFRHTIRALYRSETFSATAGALRRVTAPTNRSARLAIVLTARAHGVPIETGDLDLIRRALDRDDPDAGPLLAGLVERLAQAYGRDAVRLLLTPG